MIESILQLGSGMKRLTDAVNIDIVASVNPDIVHDLNVCPWPLPDDQFQRIVAFDVIEHLDNIVRTMEEIHRVSRSGATLEITVPHFSSVNAFTDPTHKHYFSVRSFNYFTGDNEFGFYTDKRFKIRRAEIIFYPSLMDKIVRRLAKRWPEGYERKWAWIFPAWFLSFELEVIK